MSRHACTRRCLCVLHSHLRLCPSGAAWTQGGRAGVADVPRQADIRRHGDARIQAGHLWCALACLLTAGHVGAGCDVLPIYGGNTDVCGSILPHPPGPSASSSGPSVLPLTKDSSRICWSRCSARRSLCPDFFLINSSPTSQSIAHTSALRIFHTYFWTSFPGT